MYFISILSIKNRYKLLYKLLEERSSEESISHKYMPSYEEHVIFVANNPYRYWFFIVEDFDTVVGSIYMTKNNEIGISIFKEHRRKGYAVWALNNIKQYARYELYANINPANQKSIELFEKAGFKHIQNTYKLG